MKACCHVTVLTGSHPECAVISAKVKPVAWILLLLLEASETLHHHVAAILLDGAQSDTFSVNGGSCSIWFSYSDFSWICICNLFFSVCWWEGQSRSFLIFLRDPFLTVSLSSSPVDNKQPEWMPNHKTYSLLFSSSSDYTYHLPDDW